MRAAVIICLLAMVMVASIQALPLTQEDKEKEALREQQRKEDEESNPFKRAQDMEYKRLDDGEKEALREQQRKEDEESNPFKRAEDTKFDKRSICETVQAKCSTHLNVWDISHAIPYAYCDSNADKDATQRAMQSITDMVPEIKFTETNCDDGQHHINIKTDGSGCYAHIGLTCGASSQTVNLEKDRCTSEGVIIHEFLHSLGLSHTQQRKDSGLYVTKNLENIKDGLVSQFDTNEEMCTKCTYLTCSVMHYGAYTFSKVSGSAKTLEPKDNLQLITMGIQKGLSAYDICTLKQEYGLTDTDCENKCAFGTDFDGAFSCNCLCPSGIKGTYCDEFDEGTIKVKLSAGETHTWGTTGDAYNNNEKTNFILYTDEPIAEYRIHYTFEYNDVEDDKDCYWDQFNFWKGKSILYCPDTICGDNSGMSGKTEANFFYVFFHSDDWFTARGFQIKFEVKPE